MQIDVTLKVNEQLKSLNASNVQSSELAKGWCEIEGIFKFPVRVLKYNDKSDGKLKMFVSFPQKKNGDGYDEIVHPVSKEIRTEVQDAVLNELKKSLTKEVILTSNVTDVKINMLKEAIKTGAVSLKAMASITLCGFIINGIQVKESERGLFIQMPQHKAGNDYHDTVYGTNALIQQEIKEKVLAAYESKLEQKLEEKAVQSIEEKSPNSFEEKLEREVSVVNQKRVSEPDKLIIDNTECTFVDSWKNHYASYVVGQCIEDERFYFVRFETNGEKIDDGYDHKPSREEIEDDHIYRLAQMELDKHEKVYGADSSLAYPNESSESVNVQNTGQLSKTNVRAPKM